MLQPPHFLERVNEILGAPGTSSAQLLETLARIEALYQECLQLR